MDFYDMMKELKKLHSSQIVICNLGGFYVALGADAIKLNEILGLKLTCFKDGVCKVGFPLNSLEKYKELLIKSGYGYILYHFNNEKEEINIVESFRGSFNNEETRENIDCYSCEKCKSEKKKDSKYSNALKKLELNNKIYEEKFKNYLNKDNEEN